MSHDFDLDMTFDLVIGVKNVITSRQVADWFCITVRSFFTSRSIAATGSVFQSFFFFS
jgi:hypothetical protein